ncbi:WYL domain-containing protein [Halovulum dunhuangense]|uniref:WYL domain-containing protein n=1 Tax=Halovulum dunhuangense TaxID=1505036 RepID=A0A849KX42_9RHOB|nr:WYL domain-containing protein [Halovulum dunhuangense]NNU78987.1 WYL domain-containing protein [Halovulum dunhuangense]
MSFAKALDLLRLADMAMGRHSGVTLEEIAEAFRVSHRTAQRMAGALAEAFPHAVERREDADRRLRIRLRDVPLARLRLSGDAELEALELAIARLRDEGDRRQADRLEGLRDRLLAALPPAEARRAEADAEALLESHGVAARPGPVPKDDPILAEAVAQALRGPYRMRFSYNGTLREVEPYGVLLGARRYLVAKQPNQGEGLRHFRFDRIVGPEVTDIWFGRDPGFDLAAHSARAFGSFQDESQHAEVVWHFTPAAAARAADWRFHPRQQTRPLPDGGLEVRFHASGWLEMAWHLYQWGDQVEVVAPEALRALVHPYRRDDFDALP